MSRAAALTTVALTLLVLALPAAASAANTKGKVGDAIVVISGEVSVDRGETVNGVFVIHGDTKVAGRVDGDVIVISGDTVVSGRVEGDLVAISGRARLLPSARIGGDVRYGDERPLIAPGAVVEGNTEKESGVDSIDLLPFIGAFALWLAVTLSSAVLGILLLLIAPRAADAIHARSRERIGPVIAIGIAIFIVLPVTAFLAAITLVGLPLAVGIGLALLPLAAIAYVTTAWALGRTILKPPRERVLAFLVGLAILRVVEVVPILGLLVWLGAVVFGLGLIGSAIGQARKPSAETPVSTPGI